MRGILLRVILAAAAVISAANLRGETRWLESEHNFGAFDEEDGTVTCTFRMVNKGPDDVAVRSARASCGCTTPRYPHSAIAPGDTAAITVAYNPTGRPGRFSKTVKITLSDGAAQTLTVKGVVIGSQNTLRSRYPIEAGAVKLRTRQVPFGTVLKGKAKSTFLEVYNASKSPISPKWENVPDYIRITASSDTIPPGEQAVYSMVLTPSQTELYGILTDSVNLAVPGGAPIKIDITAILEEDFSRLTPEQMAKSPQIAVEPDRVDFGEFPADSAPLTRTFEIYNRGKSDLLIRRIYTTDPGVSVSLPTHKIKKGKHATATLAVDPSALPSPLLNARIQIIANDPAMPITIVRAVGIPM